jgi:hypothetical protein
MRNSVTNKSTRAAYEGRWRKLKAVLGAPSVVNVARSPAKHIPKLKAGGLQGVESTLTLRNLVTSVMAAFRYGGQLIEADEARRLKLRAAWSAYHDALDKEVEDAYMRNEPISSRQADNYVTFDEIEAKLAELLAASPDGADAHATVQTSMQTLLLAFYVHLVPKRSDYGALHVVRAAQAPGELDGRANYVLLPPVSAAAATTSASAVPLLVLNQFKTAGKHKEIVEALPGPLVIILEQSLRRWPRKFVFVTKTSQPMTNNAFTKFVIRTFARLFDGRAAGTSLLRHAYVSERVDFNNMSMAERGAIAKQMGHSTEMQEKVYKWVNRMGSPRVEPSGNSGQQVAAGAAAAPKGKPRMVTTCSCVTRPA